MGKGRWVADLGHEVQGVTGSTGARVQFLDFMFTASG